MHNAHVAHNLTQIGRVIEKSICKDANVSCWKHNNWGKKAQVEILCHKLFSSL
jgi:hypothetical protein